MMKIFKIFAWDFHGTLERGVEVGFWQILKRIAKEYGIKENFQLSQVRRLYGISVAAYLRHFFPESKNRQIRAMMTRVAQVQNQEHLKQFVEPAPNVIFVLNQIKKAGHKNIVVSNSDPRHIGPLIELLGMHDLIDEVYALDRHYSDRERDGVEEKVKALVKIAKKHKLGKRQLIAIGDRVTDINAGLAVGAITYQYLRPGFEIDKTDAHFKIKDLRKVLREI